MLGGKIVVIATASGLRETIESTQDFYNDGGWHYITVGKIGNMSVAWIAFTCIF